MDALRTHCLCTAISLSLFSLLQINIISLVQHIICTNVPIDKQVTGIILKKYDILNIK